MPHNQPPRPGGTAEFETGITSRANATRNHFPTAPTPRPDPNTTLRRPEGTKPTGRPARDTVTGLNSHTAQHPQIPGPQNQSPRPGGTTEFETGITSRANSFRANSTRNNFPTAPTPRPEPNTPPRRPEGTNPTGRAARDIVTGLHGHPAQHPQNPLPQNHSPSPAGTTELETGITSRANSSRANSPRNNFPTAPTPRPDPNTPSIRPVGTNPTSRPARDTVTGLNSHIAQHPQNPLPQNQSPCPGGTPEFETGITSRANSSRANATRNNFPTAPTPRPDPVTPPHRPPGAKPNRLARDTITGILCTIAAFPIMNSIPCPPALGIFAVNNFFPLNKNPGDFLANRPHPVNPGPPHKHPCYHLIPTGQYACRKSARWCTMKEPLRTAVEPRRALEVRCRRGSLPALPAPPELEVV